MFFTKIEIKFHMQYRLRQIQIAQDKISYLSPKITNKSGLNSCKYFKNLSDRFDESLSKL